MSDNDAAVPDEMVLLTEKCVQRDCGRVRHSELTDDEGTHWHVRQGIALVPLATLLAAESRRVRAETLWAVHEQMAREIDCVSGMVPAWHDGLERGQEIVKVALRDDATEPSR